MVLEIVNTVLLLLVIMLNIKILNIVNNLQKKHSTNPQASLADLADEMMSCDVRDARDAPSQNIYTVATDNDKSKLLENCQHKEWTEIHIDKQPVDDIYHKN